MSIISYSDHEHALFNKLDVKESTLFWCPWTVVLSCHKCTAVSVDSSGCVILITYQMDRLLGNVEGADLKNNSQSTTHVDL